ncbi:MAG: cupin domain-containing protein [Rhodospirillales bacterium]|nr:cupin domain-containing protein [Rhodospirillales bacterium]
MADEQELNADLSAHVIMHAEDMAWEETGAPGLMRKRFELLLDPIKGRETSLYKFDSGVALPKFPLDERTEIMVLEGTVSDGQGTYAKGVYVRIPPFEPVALSSETGCVILVRKRQRVGKGSSRVMHDSNSPDAWEEWGDRGSHKIQLYDRGELHESSWLARMPADIHIPDHDHAGGEEVFVLEGGIGDADGVAGPGTWIRFPIGYRHASFSLSEGCVVMVREGDVV